jgi:hypothetical protein
MNQSKFLIAIALIFGGAALRLIDIGGVNFAPIGAIAVFSGLMFRRKWMAFALPLLATVIGDCVLAVQNDYDFANYVFSPIMLFVYAGWLLYVCCGMLVRGRWNRTSSDTKRGWLLCGGSLAGSVLFFIVSNLGVWVLGPVHTLETLTSCFVKAIPFYRGTLFSDLIYLAVLIAAHAALTATVSSKQTNPDTMIYAD